MKNKTRQKRKKTRRTKGKVTSKRRREKTHVGDLLESSWDGDELLNDGSESLGVVSPVEDRSKVEVGETERALQTKEKRES